MSATCGKTDNSRAGQVVHSKSELLRELQGLPVTKAVIYRNVDRTAWEQIATEHQTSRAVCIILR